MLSDVIMIMWILPSSSLLISVPWWTLLNLQIILFAYDTHKTLLFFRGRTRRNEVPNQIERIVLVLIFYVETFLTCWCAWWKGSCETEQVVICYIGCHILGWQCIKKKTLIFLAYVWSHYSEKHTIFCSWHCGTHVLDCRSKWTLKVSFSIWNEWL